MSEDLGEKCKEAPVWLERNKEGKAGGEGEILETAGLICSVSWLLLCVRWEPQEGFEEAVTCCDSLGLLCGEWTEGPGGGRGMSQAAAEETQGKDDGGYIG